VRFLLAEEYWWILDTAKSEFVGATLFARGMGVAISAVAIDAVDDQLSKHSILQDRVTHVAGLIYCSIAHM
jgi:hypothetical protein